MSFNLDQTINQSYVSGRRSNLQPLNRETSLFPHEIDNKSDISLDNTSFLGEKSFQLPHVQIEEDEFLNKEWA